jgi:hypothetical protein
MTKKGNDPIKTRKRMIFITFFSTFVFFLLFVCSYRETIFQEGNPLPILVGIFKLHVLDKDMIQISNEPDRKYVMRSLKGMKPLDEMLSKGGWTETYEFGGAMRSFRKGNKEIGIHSRMYTGKYIILTWYEY